MLSPLRDVASERVSFGGSRNSLEEITVAPFHTMARSKATVVKARTQLKYRLKHANLAPINDQWAYMRRTEKQRVTATD